jgi:hypothetical protein
MRIIAAAALIASSFTPVALPPLVSAAAADSVDGSNCNLTQSASSGWTCDQQSSSDTYYSIGQGSFDGITCQDYRRTTSTYVGVNSGGRAVNHFSGTSSTDVPVGDPYFTDFSGCNYPPP